MKIFKLFFSLFLLSPLFALTYSQQLAFPGAEGFGRFTLGGRGGAVLEVTNLNDSGTGSLRDAVGKNYPRIIIFKISGTIHLNSTLEIKYGNLTIAGQTAPGDGICLADYTTQLKDSANNVIIRYIRFRLGDIHKVENDSFWGRHTRNIIIDHCSFTWAIDENGSWYDNRDFTMQWCLNGESLYHSYHSKGDHGYGGIWGGIGATFHHNLLADNSSRNPRFNGARYYSTHQNEIADFRNNVIFNWGYNSAYGGESGNYNMVNNYYKPGPATSSGNRKYRIVNPSDALNPATGYSQWYIDGNYIEGNATVTADNWNGGVQPDHAPLDSIKLNSPIDVAPVTTESAQDAYTSVLANVGANFPKRDAVDQRIIDEVISGNAPYGASYNGGNKGIIDSQNDVGGWPTLNSTLYPTDSDHDGMPDSWENSHSLNPNDSTDSRTLMQDGYTAIEDYINGLLNNSTGLDNDIKTIPNKFIVNQNYPNPFNPSTTLSFSIPQSCNVEISIYNSIGQKVKTLLNSYLERGNHNLTWDGKDNFNRSLSSGVYLGLIKYGSSFKSIKMIMLK